MIGHTLKALIGSALVFAAFIFAWRWGEELWYGRYPVEDGYAAYWADDHRLAHPILRAYAREGDPRAQTYVGLQYEDGKGTFRSEWLAARWMRRAAEQDYPDALVKMGAYHVNGTGVGRNLTAAREFFQRAADLGHPYGTTGIGVVYRRQKDTSTGLQWINRSIDEGSSWAHDIKCSEEIRPWRLTPRTMSRQQALLHCLTAGLAGFSESFYAAMEMLQVEDSPILDLEKAYELVIVGRTWWPGRWETLNGRRVGVSLDVMLDAPTALPDYTIVDGAVVWPPESGWSQYFAATLAFAERLRLLAADPTMDPGPPAFGPEAPVRLDEAAMVRAEAAARDYLIENPQAPHWME